MQCLTHKTLKGVWATVLLPLDDNDAIDWWRLDDELTKLISSGLHGIYTHGTAGEFHTLTEREFDEINHRVSDRCHAAELPFQIGAGHMSAQTAFSRVRRARELDPWAIQVALPDWLPLSDTEILRFLEKIAGQAAPVPLVLYNPPHAKTRVTPDLLVGKILTEIPTLIGVKVAADDAWYATISDGGARCALFVAGHSLASGLARGAHGSYSNIASMTPTGALRWWQLMHSEPARALDVERQIGSFFNRYITPLQEQGFSNPALDKLLAYVGSWTNIGLRVRWPHDSIPDDVARQAREKAQVELSDLLSNTTTASGNCETV